MFMNIAQHIIDNLDGKQKGEEITFLCPVHADTKPSASYNIAKNVWHCFSCGAKGSGNTLHKQDNVTYINRTMDTNLIKTYTSNLFNQNNQHALHYLLNERKLPMEAIKTFNLGYDPDTDAITIPVYTSNVCTNVVRRFFKGECRYKGMSGVKSRIFGLDLALAAGGNSIAITEGEFDCVASYVLSSYKLPAISLGGVRNTPPTLLDTLKNYTKIYIIFDPDKAGDEGGESLALMLGKERCYKVTLASDINDLLVNDPDPVSTYRDAIKIAKPYGEARISDWTSALNQSIQYLTEGYQTGISTGHPNLDELFGGLRKGTLTVLTAKPGLGKTTLASNIAYNIAVKSGIKTLVCSFEQHFSYSSSLQMLSTHLGRNVELQKEFTPADIQELRDTEQALSNIQWLNHHGRFDTDRLEQDIRAAYRDGCRFIVIDHLQILVDSTDTSQVERIMNMFVRLKDSHPEIILFLLVQPKRLQDEQRALNMRDLKGGAGIEAAADTILAIDGDPRYIATLKVRSSTVLVPVGSYCYINFNKATYKFGFDPVHQTHTEDSSYL